MDEKSFIQKREEIVIHQQSKKRVGGVDELLVDLQCVCEHQVVVEFRLDVPDGDLDNFIKKRFLYCLDCGLLEEDPARKLLGVVTISITEEQWCEHLSHITISNKLLTQKEIKRLLR